MRKRFGVTHFLCFVATLAVVAAPHLGAQDASAIAAGTRVKLTAASIPSDERLGRIVAATRDTIEFRSDARQVPRTFALSEISMIEVSGGMETHGARDAAFGGVGLAIVGWIVGAATANPPPKNCIIFCQTASNANRTASATTGALLGGILGALGGVYVGSRYDRREKWVKIRDESRVSIGPSGDGTRLAFNYKF